MPLPTNATLETLRLASFLREVEPFSLLSPREREALEAHSDIFYFKEGDRIATKGEKPTRYFIIAKGLVRGHEEGERGEILGFRDSFEAEAILQGGYTRHFSATEEALLFGIEAEEFVRLLRTHGAFERYYLDSLAQKLETLSKRRATKDLSLFLNRPIKETPLQKPLFISAKESILRGVERLSEAQSDALLVEFESGHGIITNTTLRERVILGGVGVHEPCSAITTPRLITLDEEESLFSALLSLIEHHIQRLVITRGAERRIIGILDQVDLLSALASKGHSIHAQIQKAQSVDELAVASKETLTLIKTLQAQGGRARQITRLLSELNRQLYARLFTILMPPSLVANAALLMLGSEGRGEQTLRSDQDNALILRDGFETADLEGLCERFSEALETLGFPLCPGNIMLSNPLYRRPLSEYLQEIEACLSEPTGERLLRFSILFDASCVAGDSKLGEELRQKMFQRSLGEGLFLSHFALAATRFETPLSLFSNFITDEENHKGELDIKKGAIFPLVHGVRALSLKHGCAALSTLERLQELREKGVLSEEFGEELAQAFEFLLGLKMEIELEKSERNLPLDNYLNPHKLGRFERDLLRDVFKITARFKRFLAQHFQLHRVS